MLVEFSPNERTFHNQHNWKQWANKEDPWEMFDDLGTPLGLSIYGEPYSMS